MSKLAIITGASTGIGFELAHIAADDGYDLIVVADEPLINAAADDLRGKAGISPLSKPISQRSTASTSSSQRPRGGRSTCFAPMPAGRTAAPFSSRRSMCGATRLTPTSPARSI